MDTTNMAVLFDFDGVVMDTEKQYSIFWAEQGRKYHPELPGFDRLIKGQTLTRIFDRYFAGNIELQKRIQKELYCFEEDMPYEYLPGVAEFVGDLRSHGVKLAIVTSSNRVKMENVYRTHPELKGLFDFILTSDDFTKSKPDPDCFLRAAQKLQTPPENCFVFEDSFHGLEAAQKAGMTVIGLSTTNSREEISDKAVAVISDFLGMSFDKLLRISDQHRE